MRGVVAFFTLLALRAPGHTLDESIFKHLMRWFRPRLFISTWLILFVAGAALAILEIPGRRTGFTTYAHGWPLTYLTRDYQQEPHFLNWDEGRWTTKGWLQGVCGQRWVDADSAAAE